MRTPTTMPVLITLARGAEDLVWSYSGENVDGTQITVDTQEAIIEFSLQLLAQEDEAEFAATETVYWYDPSTSQRIAMPDSFEVLRYAQRLFIHDTNTNHNSMDATYWFRINILYNGENKLSPDPTIINKEVPPTCKGRQTFTLAERCL